MPITVAQIDLWRAAPSESQILEFKEPKNGFDRNRLAEYCVAIANEGGGHFLLGVANVSPRPVVGSEAFPNPVEAANEIFQRVGFRVEIEAACTLTDALSFSQSLLGQGARPITWPAVI